ncbi:MAG: response regulator, partial [Planctomycetota bacterium]
VAHTPGPENCGSEFCIRLPLTSETAVEEEHQRSSTALAGKKVLLIEDHDGIRNMLARALELKGMQVATASDGLKGLQLYDEFQPGISVIDIGLPDLSGYEVAEAIRSREAARTTLVAVTGYGRNEDVIKTREAGFDLHLLKPIDPVVLVERLAEIESSELTSG